MDPSHSLPLFPLNVVIFPESRLPLHIFEERYRTMVTDAIENGTEFGINLLEKNHLHPVGCAVSVVSVVRRYPDGSFDIIVEGVRRYRLLEYHGTQVGYLQGTVEEVADDADMPDEAQQNRVVALYNAILSIGFPQEQPDMFASLTETTTMSFRMAEKAGLDLPAKQRLLEMSSERRRIDFLVEHMETVIPVLREQEQLQKLIINDGYLPAYKPGL